jgi:hypothetical protein
MDPTTIGLLISIAPTVLDLLFGQGHIKKSLHPQRYSSKNMYDYGLEGYGMYGQGYRYPRRRRKLTVETFYSPEVQPELIRAAVFNRAIAKKNDWIQHLHNSGFYDNVRKLLQAARATYKPKDPVKRQKVLNRELTRLKAELKVLQNERAARSLAPKYAQTLGKKYTDLTYDDVLKDKIERLEKEIARIEQSMPTGQLQLLVPK